MLLLYDQNKRFTFPQGLNLCDREFVPDYEPETTEESVEGVFD